MTNLFFTATVIYPIFFKYHNYQTFASNKHDIPQEKKYISSVCLSQWINFHTT